jgi:predicted nucleotidyltransferase
MKEYTANEILEILRTHKSLLKKYKVNRIGLFGSHSRNQSNNESDIDLIVDFEEKTFDNFIELAFDLEDLFGRKVDLLTEKGISPYILPYIKDDINWYETR